MIERLAQGLTPRLVPAGLAARVAATVGVPAADAVGAAPGGVLDDLHLVRGRVYGEVLAVVGELGEFVGLDVMQSVGERHLSLVVVVAVGFAVGGDVHELFPPPAVRESADEALGEAFAVGKQAFKGDGARNGAVK